MSRAALGGAVMALALVACATFVGVAIHELGYASDHPHQYGPAKVIATAAGAGALLSLAVAALGWAWTRSVPAASSWPGWRRN